MPRLFCWRQLTLLIATLAVSWTGCLSQDLACFITTPSPGASVLSGEGVYRLDVEYVEPGQYAIYVLGNSTFTFTDVLIQADQKGLEEWPNTTYSDRLGLGLCHNSLVNGVPLRDSSQTIALFRPRAAGCTDIELTVVGSDANIYINVTQQICVDVDNVTAGCGPPPSISNANLVASDFELAAYRCNAGFRENTPINISCFDTDQWENGTSYCQDINECLEKQQQLGCHTCVNIPGSFSCLCNQSYELLGQRCLRSCGNPGHPASGSFTSNIGQDVYVLNTELTFSCVVGYRLVGSSKITCIQGNNTSGAVIWSAASPTCVAADDEPSGSGLSSTTIAGIVVGTLAGVAIIALIVVVAIVTHTRNIYKTLAKQQSKSSLQSATQRMVRSVSAASTTPDEADYTKPSSQQADNRRSSRRNSRQERRSRKWSSESLQKTSDNFQLSPVSGDVSFQVPLCGVIEDGEEDFTAGGNQSYIRNDEMDVELQSPGSGNELLVHDDTKPNTDYAAIGPKGEIL